MKYIIRDLYSPSHSGECEFGFSMENRGGRWYWITDSAFAKPGSTTVYQHKEFELPEDFFIGLTWSNFADKLNKAAPGCGLHSWDSSLSYAKDKASIEALFRPEGGKRHG